MATILVIDDDPAMRRHAAHHEPRAGGCRNYQSAEATRAAA